MALIRLTLKSTDTAKLQRAQSKERGSEKNKEAKKSQVNKAQFYSKMLLFNLPYQYIKELVLSD